MRIRFIQGKRLAEAIESASLSVDPQVVLCCSLKHPGLSQPTWSYVTSFLGVAAAMANHTGDPYTLITNPRVCVFKGVFSDPGTFRGLDLARRCLIKGDVQVYKAEASGRVSRLWLIKDGCFGILFCLGKTRLIVPEEDPIELVRVELDKQQTGGERGVYYIPADCVPSE